MSEQTQHLETRCRCTYGDVPVYEVRTAEVINAPFLNFDYSNLWLFALCLRIRHVLIHIIIHTVYNGSNSTITYIHAWAMIKQLSAELTFDFE